MRFEPVRGTAGSLGVFGVLGGLSAPDPRGLLRDSAELRGLCRCLGVFLDLELPLPAGVSCDVCAAIDAPNPEIFGVDGVPVREGGNGGNIAVVPDFAVWGGGLWVVKDTMLETGAAKLCATEATVDRNVISRFVEPTGEIVTFGCNTPVGIDAPSMGVCGRVGEE